MKGLTLGLILLTTLLSCTTTNEKKDEIQSVLLPYNMTWKNLQIGLSDIDSLRKIEKTDFFILYGNILIHGNAPIHYYAEVDSISLEYEAGIIEYKYLNCAKVKDTINTTLIIEGESLVFKNKKELVFQNKTFLETKKMFDDTKKDLKTIILKEIKNCNR